MKFSTKNKTAYAKLRNMKTIASEPRDKTRVFKQQVPT